VSEVGELGDNVAKERDVTDDIGDCLVVLNNLAIMNDTTLEECLKVAYNDIKDRKGHMNTHGVFIKEGDAA
jgi:NTP pyrophosphatase (non-canonical NTP hydrolase)